MEQKFYLQWNVVNWLTVVLMASTGALAMGALVAGVKSYGPKSDAG